MVSCRYWPAVVGPSRDSGITTYMGAPRENTMFHFMVHHTAIF